MRAWKNMDRPDIFFVTEISKKWSKRLIDEIHKQTGHVWSFCFREIQVGNSNAQCLFLWNVDVVSCEKAFGGTIKDRDGLFIMSKEKGSSPRILPLIFRELYGDRRTFPVIGFHGPIKGGRMHQLVRLEAHTRLRTTMEELNKTYPFMFVMGDFNLLNPGDFENIFHLKALQPLTRKGKRKIYEKNNICVYGGEIQLQDSGMCDVGLSHYGIHAKIPTVETIKISSKEL